MAKENINNQLSLLRMTFDNIVQLSDEIISYTIDDTVYIADTELNVIDTCSKSNARFTVEGKFIIYKSNPYSSFTNKIVAFDGRIAIKKKFSRSVTYSIIDESYIKIKDEYFSIYNDKLEEIVRLNITTLDRAPICDDNTIKIPYSNNPNIYNTIVINKLTGKAIVYDHVKLDNGVDLVSIDNEPNFNGSSINTYTKDELRYTIEINGTAIQGQSYSDIIFRSDLSNTNYLYTVDFNGDKNSKPTYGLIENTGAKILDAIYNSIKRVGDELFVLDFSGMKSIYDRRRNCLLFAFTDVADITIHDTLPLSIVRFKDNRFVCVDSKCRIFNPCDIAKYFDCYYSNEHANIIKVVINEYTTKYINTSYVPITNLKEISKLQLDTWIKM